VSVDYGDWLQWELWSLDEAALLLCGIDPDSKRASLLKEAFKRDTEPEDERDREVCRTYCKALSAIDAGKLSYHLDCAVEPHVFLRWARKQRFSLPEELAVFLTSRDKKPRPEKPLSTRERRTFLVIIAAALKEAGIDITHPEKAAQTVAEITERMGTPIDHQTIVNKLKEIPDALESRRK
jgi:hypothetical protein